MKMTYMINCFFAAIVINLVAVTGSDAQFDIPWHTIDNGGGSTAGGPFELQCTIGQHDASEPMSSNSFTLAGGFWVGENGHDIVLGDVNGDGAVNLLDVAPFIDAITNGPYIPEADINQDGFVNLLDVDPFIALLGG